MRKSFHALWDLAEKVFGLGRRSMVAKYAQKILHKKLTHQILGVGLVASTSAIYMIHNFGNIGGEPSLNVAALATPKAVIDAHTTQSVQAPIVYEYESRGFSFFHSGADLVAPVGTAVRPVMEGTVEQVLHDSFGYGQHVIIAHAEGYESLYGHLSEIEVKQGQKVNLQTEVGKSGNTGFSTGPHLHLELRLAGEAINPAEVVPGIN